MFKRKQKSKTNAKMQPKVQTDAQRDGELLKRKFPVSWIFSLLAFVLFLFAAVLLAFYFAAGTARGTQFFLDKINSETGIHLNYQKGNLKDGLLVTDIEFEADDTTVVKVDEATVKIGWQAVFNKQLHLRHADIGHIDIINSKQSDGKPFKYPTLKLPVNALLDEAEIAKISYRQNGRRDVVLNNINANTVSWVNSHIKLSNGQLSYSDYLHFTNVKGDIDLKGGYPLNATAKLTVDQLQKANIDTLNLKVTGSLKHAIAKVTSQYNGYPIVADVDAQLLDSKLPFNAKVYWNEAKLPYLQKEDISLKKGVANFNGNFNDIDMRINTSVSANSIIPNGQYQGRAKIYPRQGLKIQSVQIQSPEGELAVEGDLNWQQAFVSRLTINSAGYKIADVIPKKYQQFLPYAPERLNGKLNFDYRYRNTKGKQQYDFKLAQNKGELVDLQLIRGNTPTSPKIPRTWIINSNWQNYYRANIPNIGIIDTKNGQAKVSIKGKQISVDGSASLTKLHDAPAGDYDAKFVYNPNKININRLIYAGIAGDLTGSGQLLLATNKRPFFWDISADTNQLFINKLFENSPVQEVTGTVSSKGKITQTKDGTVYDVNFEDATLSALLGEQLDNRAVNVTNAKGNAILTMSNIESGSELTKFDVDFVGGADTTDLPAGNWQAKVSGTPTSFKFEQLNYTGEIGGFDGELVLDLGKDANKNINWDINGDLDNLDLQFFAPSLTAVATGKLQTQGEWIKSDNPEKFGQLGNFNAKFDGNIDTPKLPKGDLLIDAKGKAGIVDFNTLSYIGEAGALTAKGILDTRNNLQWDASATLNKFNLQYLLPNTPAILTGDLTSKGVWLPPEQPNKTNIAKQLNDFNIDFDGNIDTKSLPKGTLALTASGSGANYVVDKFYHSGDAGNINASGTLDITNGYKWQLDANMDKLNLAYFNAKMPSKLSGSVVTFGNWQDGKQSINIEQLDITGQLKGEPIKATGQLNANMHLPDNLQTYFNNLKSKNLQQQYNTIDGLIDNLDAKNLQVKWGNSLISSNGTKSDLQTNISIPNLQQISDNLTGKLVGGINVVRLDAQTKPAMFIDLLASGLGIPNVSMANGRVIGKLVSSDNSTSVDSDINTINSQLLLTASDIKIANKQFDNLKAVINGSLPEHQVDLTLANAQLDFSALLKGGYDKNTMRWQGVIGKGKAITKYTTLEQLQPAQLKLDMQSSTIALAAHCWATPASNNKSKNNQGSLCLEQNLQASKNSGVLDLSVNQIHSQLLSFVMPKNLSWNAKLSGNTNLEWKKGQPPVINGMLYSNNGKFGIIDDNNNSITVPYKRVSLIAKSVADGLKIRTEVDSVAKGKAFADVQIDPYSDDKPISGVLALDNFDIAIFKPFFANVRTLTGTTSLNGKVSGTLTNPKFIGNARLSKGNLSVIGLPINLSNIEVASKIDGSLANIKGRFNSGKGVGKLVGTVDWRNQLQAKINLSGKNLLLSQPPLMTANINPDIDFIIKPAAKYLNMQGVISVPSATFRPPEITQDVISINPDVIVLDRRLSGNLEEVLAISKPWSINSKVGIDLGDKVRFQGFGAELPLAGAIVINQKNAEITAKGLVQVSRSTEVDAFGQSLSLNYAQLRFNGNAQKPNLSIEADKEIEGKTVGLRVKGEILDPVITVFNDAGLTEQQAMNALATGRLSTQAATQVSEEGFRSEISNNLAAAGISLGLSGTRNLTNQIGRAFGLQSLTVSAAGNSDDTSVNVTGYITPDLYVRYGIGVFSAQSKLSARYQLTKRVYVEATSAVEDFIDVVYSWSF